MTGYRIPRKRVADGEPEQSTSTGGFTTTTPGTASGNFELGPELIKKARTMRFEGRLDKGGIGQQLVLAGFHSMSIEEKLKLAEELESVESQVAPEAPQAHLDALIKIYERPYAKWGPAYANQLLTMFPKPSNSPVGPAPRFK
jgi:hypothetical protein